MKKNEYYNKTIVINICLIIYHISIFIGFFMQLAAISLQIYNYFFIILNIIFIVCMQFVFHSIPNIIVYKQMRDYKDIHSFIKVEIVIFSLVVFTYLLLVVYYFFDTI